MTLNPRMRVIVRQHLVAATADPGQWPDVTKLTSGRALETLPVGYTAWAVGNWDDDPDVRAATREGISNHIVVLPTLVDDAPPEIHSRLMARAVAIGTGKCPLCSGRAGLTQQPPAPGEPRASFHAFPVYVRIEHSQGCPADDWSDDDRQWFAQYRDGHNERSR